MVKVTRTPAPMKQCALKEQLLNGSTVVLIQMSKYPLRLGLQVHLYDANYAVIKDR